MKDFFSLLWTKWVVTLKDLFNWLKVVYLYYPNAAFAKIDLTLLCKYIFKNPYRISKQFLIARGEDNPYAYGETPLTTLALIAKNCQFTSADRVIELGCGRGRTCFWLQQFIHCEVLGIDFVPEFIQKANEVKEKCHLTHLAFECADFLETDLTGATLIYLYGTCLDEKSIRRLIEKIGSGTRVVTVSYPLEEYSPQFELIRTFPAAFPWGEAEVFLQLKL
jgi:SAM-dependent methyltransferase